MYYKELVIECENRTRWGTNESLDLAMSLADESANKHSCSMQLYVNKVNFLKLMRVVLKHIPLERWIQLMIGGLKTVNLAWINKTPMISYTWLFVYESLRRYEGWMNAAPVSCSKAYKTMQWITQITSKHGFRRIICVVRHSCLQWSKAWSSCVLSNLKMSYALPTPLPYKTQSNISSKFHQANTSIKTLFRL